MAVPLYRQYFRELMNEHEQQFTDFKMLHDKYQADQDTWQKEYNEKGKPILKLLQEQEARLCGKMERGVNAKYSAQLADKYWGEVRSFFPMIDYVGVIWS